MGDGNIRQLVKDLARLTRDAADKSKDDKGHKDGKAEHTATFWAELDRILSPEQPK